VNIPDLEKKKRKEKKEVPWSRHVDTMTTEVTFITVPIQFVFVSSVHGLYMYVYTGTDLQNNLYAEPYIYTGIQQHVTHCHPYLR